MKNSFIISMKTSKRTIPLTVPIHNEHNIQTMYNVIHHMVAQKFLIDEGDGEKCSLDPECIIITDEKGSKIDPVKDLEWYGTSEDNKNVKMQVLDNLEQMAKEDGDSDIFNRESVEMAMPRYYVISKADGDRIHLTPTTWDSDKANDMFNAIKYGINTDIRILSKNNTEIDRKNIFICSGPCIVRIEEEDPKWALRTDIDSELTLTDEDLVGLENMSEMNL